MKHIEFEITPISYLDHFSRKWNTNIYCKRDDLFLRAGGGNKVRMLNYILYPIIHTDVKTIVTAGGPNSNFNRALALMCAEFGLNLNIISYTDHQEEYLKSLNHKIINLTRTNYIYCKKTEVPEVINHLLKAYDEQSLLYKFIYGGGKSLEGIFAYYDAIRELRSQSDIDYEHFFVACGTGTTVAGMSAGLRDFYPKAKLHAISVARSWEMEEKVLNEDLCILGEFLHKTYDTSNIVFYENYLSGGYACADGDILSVIKEAVAFQGLLLDPIYSGKAFRGMSDVLKSGKLKNRNILFWHTGGMFNLLSELK